MFYLHYHLVLHHHYSTTFWSCQGLWRKNMKIRISEIRKARGMTQPQLAERAGLTSYTLVQRYERGTRLPGVDIALRLARALQTTVEELFVLEDGDQPSP